MPRANVFNYYNHRRLLPRITIPSHISKIIMLPLWKIKAAYTQLPCKIRPRVFVEPSGQRPVYI